MATQTAKPPLHFANVYIPRYKPALIRISEYNRSLMSLEQLFLVPDQLHEMSVKIKVIRLTLHPHFLTRGPTRVYELSMLVITVQHPSIQSLPAVPSVHIFHLSRSPRSFPLVDVSTFRRRVPIRPSCTPPVPAQIQIVTEEHLTISQLCNLPH